MAFKTRVDMEAEIERLNETIIEQRQELHMWENDETEGQRLPAFIMEYLKMTYGHKDVERFRLAAKLQGFEMPLPNEV